MAIAQDSHQPGRLLSISRQLQQNRAAYYATLNQAQKGDLNITPWVCWFITQFSAACQHSALLMDQAIAKACFWSAHAQHDFNPRQRKTLQKLLDAGDNGFLGGLTAAKHGQISGASKATATRDLVDLLEKQALISHGVGKATKYYVNVPGWTQVTAPL